MRSIIRIAAVTGVAVLALGALPAAPAAAGPHTELRVTGAAAHEYHKKCSTTEPFTCGTFPGTMNFMIQVWNRPKPVAPITVGYEIDNGTAVAGQDFQGPTSGTVTIPTNAEQAYVTLRTIVDAVDEPDETFTLRVTSASISADIIGSPATGTIREEGAIPADCDLDRSDALTASMTCTDRPPDQTWQHITLCGFGWASEVGHGEVVTGNGTSTAECSQFTYRVSTFYEPW